MNVGTPETRMSFGSTMRREVRVALSRRAQPVWFRVLKWVIALAAGYALWRTPYFWPALAGAVALSLTLHLVWRWKTRGWTEPWGGWDDVEAADGPSGGRGRRGEVEK